MKRSVFDKLTSVLAWILGVFLIFVYLHEFVFRELYFYFKFGSDGFGLLRIRTGLILAVVVSIIMIYVIIYRHNMYRLNEIYYIKRRGWGFSMKNDIELDKAKRAFRCAVGVIIILLSFISFLIYTNSDFIAWFDGIREGGEQLIEKPVLYLYPEQETNVTVKLKSGSDITVSYPKYDGFWHVKAQPDGTLIDKNNRFYNYLYWESDTNDFEPDFSTGFCVKGSDTAAFLEEQLAYFDLSDSETDDFITYWLLRMQDNAYNLISFQFENYDEYEGLDIDPEPDCLIKVFMAYKPLDEPVQIEPQVVPGSERCGFTAVEWGGMECK